MDTSNIAVATACFPGYTLSEALAAARRLGFSAVGFLGIDGARHSRGRLPGFFWDELDDCARADLVAAYGSFKRGVMHAPFHDLPLVSANRYVEREAMRQVLVAIQAAGELGLEVVTIHVAKPRNIPEDELASRLVANIRELADAAASTGTRIGIENYIYPSDPDQLTELLDAIDHPLVGATLDTGHVIHWFERDGVSALEGEDGASRYNDRLLAFIDRLGERIVNVHIHDVRPSDLRDHRTVGRGLIDVEIVIARLEHLGYQGLLELELEEPDIELAVEESRERLEQALDAAAVGASRDNVGESSPQAGN